MAYRWGNNGNSDKLFSWAPKSLWTVTAAMRLKDDCLGRKAVTNIDSVYRDSRDVTLLTKVQIIKAMVFFRGHVWMLNIGP